MEPLDPATHAKVGSPVILIAPTPLSHSNIWKSDRVGSTVAIGRAFDAYEAQLGRLVEGKQAAAQKLLPVFATQTRLGIWFRNLVMRTMNFRRLADLLMIRSVRNDFELPNYPM